MPCKTCSLIKTCITHDYLLSDGSVSVLSPCKEIRSLPLCNIKSIRRRYVAAINLSRTKNVVRQEHAVFQRICDVAAIEFRRIYDKSATPQFRRRFVVMLCRRYIDISHPYDVARRRNHDKAAPTLRRHSFVVDSSSCDVMWT